MFAELGGAANQSGGLLGELFAEATSVGAAGAVTVTGDLYRVASTAGDAAGPLIAGGEIGLVEAFGELTALVTGRIDAAGDIGLLGGTAGSFTFSEQDGALAGTMRLRAAPRCR